MKVRKIAYWVTTVYIAFSLFYGGLAEVLEAGWHVSISSIGLIGVVQVLGYPVYVLYLIGIWKILGAIAILIPRTPRLKEWAYAGIFFNMSGAAVSWYAATIVGAAQIPPGYGSPVFHFVNAIHLLVVTLISWALRPDSRKIGNLFPWPEIREKGEATHAA
jgi:uncharacterized membrane protein YphA (DoxX/SURF4 family)